MKALVYAGPGIMEYRDMPTPEPAPGEVLVKLDSVGICGSDMHAFLGHDERRPAPLILGHEAAGTIDKGARRGQRVTVNPLISCGDCAFCISSRENLCLNRQIISMPPREGAFAEKMIIAEANLVAVPDSVSLQQAALAEPIACGWHAVRLARAILGEAAQGAKALILGGGAIGVGSALSCKAQNIADVTIIEPNDLRRTFLIKTCGLPALATQELDPVPIFDLVIDAVGNESTRAEASMRVRPGGVIAHIGLGAAMGGLDIRRMTLQEITFIGTYTYTAEDFRETARAIFEGRLGALDWAEARPLSDGKGAFADIHAGRSKAPKIILKPN